MKMKGLRLFTLCILYILLNVVNCSYLATDKEKKDIENAIQNFKKTKNIYKPKQFKGESLAFLTPWNKQGFQRVLKFNQKFEYVSPVWFEIKEISDTAQLTGEQDIDEQFLAEVRELNKKNTTNIKIIPRIYIQEEKVIMLLNDMGNREQVIEQIKRFIDKFDGFVLDSIFLSYFAVTRQYDQISFVRELSIEIRDKHHKLFFASVQGKQDRLGWKKSYMIVLLDLIDRLLVSTYDYHQIIDNLYPISPISWIEENISFFEESQLSKIIIGMPFYGFKIDNKVDFFMGDELAKLINDEEVDMVIWDEKIKECVFYSSLNEIRYFYPCLKFIDERLRLFESKKIGGVYIWELGQGQDILLEPF